MKYEMRTPPGIPGQIIAIIMEKYDDLELKQTDYGPVFYGEKEDLENAQDIVIRALNERIKELEDEK